MSRLEDDARRARTLDLRRRLTFEEVIACEHPHLIEAVENDWGSFL